MAFNFLPPVSSPLHLVWRAKNEQPQIICQTHKRTHTHDSDTRTARAESKRTENGEKLKKGNFSHNSEFQPRKSHRHSRAPHSQPKPNKHFKTTLKPKLSDERAMSSAPPDTTHDQIHDFDDDDDDNDDTPSEKKRPRKMGIFRENARFILFTLAFGCF